MSDELKSVNQSLGQLKKEKFLTIKNPQTLESKKIISCPDLQVGLKDSKYPAKGLVFPAKQAPSETSDKLYNQHGTLYFDGIPLLSGTAGTGEISNVIAGGGIISTVSSGIATVEVKYSAGTDVISSANNGTSITIDPASDKVIILDDTDSTVKYVNISQIAEAAGDITAVTAGTGLTGGGNSGDVTLGINDSIVATLSGSAFSGHVIPSTDNTYNLGSETNRWANVYTGDLHLRNDRGHWQIVEEADYLTVINRLTGKKYKMMLEPID